MNSNGQYRYGVLLRDPYDEYGAYDTLHAFNDPVLWDWLHEDVEFGPGEYDADIKAPYGEDVYVSIGSAINDKAQALGEFDTVDQVDLLTVVDEVYEGDWY